MELTTMPKNSSGFFPGHIEVNLEEQLSLPCTFFNIILIHPRVTNSKGWEEICKARLSCFCFQAKR